MHCPLLRLLLLRLLGLLLRLLLRSRLAGLAVSLLAVCRLLLLRGADPLTMVITLVYNVCSVKRQCW